jgi:indole-3-glycerol phosphate synthase/phosphoribosylanthranilate isomerase
MNVRDAIVERRRERISREGHALGAEIPAARAAGTGAMGVVPLPRAPFLICEVKRRSPSRGGIDADMDAVAQARLYASAGAAAVSVLTEEDHFGGSLQDLMAIRAALPSITLLRKDFLVDEEDVDVSFRAGADAVLLISSILDAATLEAMHRRARLLGMEALVEVHDQADVEKCRPFAPSLVGINCRDLATFATDLLHPLWLAPRVDWPSRRVFESGIRTAEDVRLARSAGFAGVLVGETVMRTPQRIPELREAVDGAPPARAAFWPRLLARRRPGRPLTKVCGITRAADAVFAGERGADVLGFVFAASKRRASAALLRDLAGLDVLKVAVVVTRRGTDPRLDPEVADLLRAGLIDAVQFHGDEAPGECGEMAFPYYKAVRVRDERDIVAMEAFRCPRVLADAYSPDAAGGTGKRVEADLARAAGRRRPLWLAGGIGPDNVGEVMRELRPELIDASSGLEESPGCKDRRKIERLFEEMERHAEV